MNIVGVKVKMETARDISSPCHGPARLESYDSVDLLSLPAEIRIAILEYVFHDNASQDIFTGHGVPGGILVDEDYLASKHLRPLLTCRQLHKDGVLAAWNRSKFIVSNLFFIIPERLSVLHLQQIEAIRSITFVADARHFRKLIEWGQHPFGMTSLQLETLTIVLQRSSFWHYLFDYTADIVKLLRGLQGVKRLVFVRNGALVKGSFKTWYNRLIGLIMKTDHHERYCRKPPEVEKMWWTWKYNDVAQSFCLQACPPKAMVDEETYMQQILPLIDELKVSVEDEEWNPDPRSRNMYY